MSGKTFCSNFEPLDKWRQLLDYMADSFHSYFDVFSFAIYNGVQWSTLSDYLTQCPRDKKAFALRVVHHVNCDFTRKGFSEKEKFSALKHVYHQTHNDQLFVWLLDHWKRLQNAKSDCCCSEIDL